MELMFGGFAVVVCSGFIVDFWWVCKGRSVANVAWARNGVHGVGSQWVVGLFDRVDGWIEWGCSVPQL